MPKKQKDKVDRRRQLIFRRVVLDNNPISLREVREILEDQTYHRGTAQTDINAFASVGCRLDIRKCKSEPTELELVFLEGPHTDADTTRESINSQEKMLVARLAVGLICGIPDPDPRRELPPWTKDANARQALKNMRPSGRSRQRMAQTLQAVLECLDEQWKPLQSSSSSPAPGAPMCLDEQGKPKTNETAVSSLDSILKLLNRTSFSTQEILKANLYKFWDTTSRLVALDSGTTNICVARLLKQMPIPLVDSQLCSLTLCTNSRRIFEELGPSRVWVKTIVIGGQQMFRSPTIAGTMAELFLRSVPILQFGMCILGSTRIDIDRAVICSDSQEESSLKNLLMERSSLRIICVDHSKLQRGPGREGYRFASIHPKHIDLILTNSPLKRAGKEAEAEYKAFVENVEAIENRGVPVLLATSKDTFGPIR